MKQMFDFFDDEQGLAVVEYAVGGALISLTVVIAFTLLGGSVEAAMIQITAYLS